MNSVLQLARHILQFQPNEDAARLCFYHFLIHHCEPTDVVDAQLMSRFNRFVLQFEHWQENSSKLLQEVQYCLQHFSESYQLSLGFKDMIMPNRWQVIALKNPIDCLKVFENHYPATATSRLVAHQPGQYLHIELTEDESVVVTQLNDQFFVNAKGHLEPLNQEVCLRYTADLRLQYQTLQYVRVSDHQIARFSILGDGVHGAMMRGYTFQKSDIFKGGKISAYPGVFYAIKRLEQHYVDRQSDPMYQELGQVIEKAIELLKMRHPEAKSFGALALERGQQALNDIFPDDNILRLLIQNLRELLKSPNTEALEPKPEARELPWSKNPNLLLVE